MGDLKSLPSDLNDQLEQDQVSRMSSLNFDQWFVKLIETETVKQKLKQKQKLSQHRNMPLFEQI